MLNKQGLKEKESIKFPTDFGNFILTLYTTNIPTQPTMSYLITLSTTKLPPIPTIRIHSSCLFNETFHLLSCDCRQQLTSSLKIISSKGGMLFYLDQEGRGHGLENKVKELKVQEDGHDTVEASELLGLKVDQREFDAVVTILKEKNISKINLITNNTRKVETLEREKIKIVERIPIQIAPNKYNKKYLEAKKYKLGHILDKYI